MATAQPASASASASGTAQGAGNSQQPAAATPAKARKPRDPNAPKKISPKAKANNEVRTYMLQRREVELQGKTGVARHVEAERFDRMLDAVESLFPAGHKFNIPRTTEAGETVTTAGGADKTGE